MQSNFLYALKISITNKLPPISGLRVRVLAVAVWNTKEWRYLHLSFTTVYTSKA